MPVTRASSMPNPSVRIRAALACLLLACALAATAPAAGAAESIEGGNAFNELSQKAQQEETTSTATTATTAASAEKETTNSRKTILLGGVVAVVLLFGIAFMIIRDVRRVAPAGPEEFDDIRTTRRDRIAKQQNRRAKAKAAKAQRRKNR